MNDYVIITPAHNEEAHLERTIEAMLAQKCRPVRWVIANDNSSDRTAAIAERYAAQWDFIRVLNIRRDGSRGFNNKARAFNAAVASLQGVEYAYIGNLDADITTSPDYFENLLRAFAADPRLGITGGSIHTKIGDRFISHDETLDSVAGAVQLFRKECFATIGGGYLPLPYGGIDAAAEIIAKMKGWTVRKLPENQALEHRQTGTASHGPLMANYRLGRRFHSLGYGFMFFALRCVYRLGNEPILLGSCAQFYGFVESIFKRNTIQLPTDVVIHLRRDQRRKLRQMFFPWSRSQAAQN